MNFNLIGIMKILTCWCLGETHVMCGSKEIAFMFYLSRTFRTINKVLWLFFFLFVENLQYIFQKYKNAAPTLHYVVRWGLLNTEIMLKNIFSKKW